MIIKMINDKTMLLIPNKDGERIQLIETENLADNDAVELQQDGSLKIYLARLGQQYNDW